MEWNKKGFKNITSIEEAKDILIELMNERTILLEKIRNLMGQLEQSERTKQSISSKLMFDSITGLPNHRKMDMDMGPLLWDFFKLSNPPKISAMLIRLDDNFRHCRQTFNTEVFNSILYTIASRIREIVHQRGLLYHPRTDEFSVFLFDSLSEEELTVIARNIQSNIESVIDNQAYKVKIGSSVGIATFPDDGLNKRMLLSNADIALNNALYRKTPILFFNEDMRNHVVGNLEMQNKLLSVMEVNYGKKLAENFALFFQPIITIAEIRENGIVPDKIKAEVLLRWHDSNRGSVLPRNLIEVAEETGLILPIGRWLLESAMETLVGWQVRYPDLELSVNISPRQFFNNNFSEDLMDIVKSTGIDPSSVYLEITETCLFDDQDQAIEEIDQLNKIGFKISLDDFGTGYSSLGYLNKFKADVLKIDRVFTDGLEHEGKKRDVITSILRIGKELDMDIVFEGIENELQLKKAFDLGCRTFQGFLLSRPLPQDVFIAFLDKSRDGLIPFQDV
ncbi:MAG: bifunctional diguanylate cyclase/phosphodiesterase [Spirochaetales bacterium]|nr:bifunctional diguanylate cyclase/phosphodiesterase [Spirochaetales bacterium]